MPDFVLGRLKFTFKGQWQSNTGYVADDIVRYGGRSYVCKINHTSSPGNGFYTDNAYARWDIVSSGTDWKGDWQTSTYYKIDDVVRYGGTVYVANTGHLSNATTAFGLEPDYDKWVTYSASPFFVGNWSANVRYRVEDVFKFGSGLYRVTIPHFSNANTSSNVTTFNTHQGNVSIFVPGLEFEDTYNNATQYQTGDIVRYGGYNFIAIDETEGNLPTDTTYWRVLSTGFKHRGDYNNSTVYEPGDVVRYGASSYVAKLDSTGNLPTNATYWDLLTRGQMWKDYYAANVAYKPGDIVRYGGFIYVANVDTAGNAPSNNTFWDLQQTGIRWNNIWDSNTTYQLGDAVNYSNSAYISIVSDNANIIPGDPGSEVSWSLAAQGSQDTFTTTLGDIAYRGNVGMTRLGIGAVGQVLTSDGSIPYWKTNSNTGNVYYVAPEGVDSAGYGTSLHAPFASIKYATQQADNNATIFVKSGEYYEQLPITVKSNMAIVGDNQRTVIINPKAGLSDDGSNTNAQSTMFLMSDGAIINKVTMRGMTGWTANNQNEQNLTSTTPRGVFVRLNPATPIIHKSPYILEAAAFGTGAIGALVDGSVHGALGNKSMVFHGYTVISSDGIGYWIKDGGRAEIVSCFTYYCKFGYATTGGGIIRALNGNNSYGKYGVYSQGFLTTEQPVTGNVYGDLISGTFTNGIFAVGDLLTGNTTGATAIITNPQISNNKLYIKYLTGLRFQNNEDINSNAGGTGNLTSNGNVAGQNGFTLMANAFSSEPAPGRSIQFSDDPTNAYVIQSVSGTFLGANSVMTIVLTQDKALRSLDNAGLILRRDYSQARLTGHDFLNVGTGNVITTNYPGAPTTPPAQGNEVVEDFPGRVFYISSDQDGNFRVGDYFRIDQATGTATLNASAFNLAGLTSLRLGSIGAQLGETINEFSSDATMGGNSNAAVPTEYAVKTYVDNGDANVLSTVNATLAGGILNRRDGFFLGAM